MSRLLVAAIATSLVLGLSSGVAAAADAAAKTTPNEGRTMWESCARVGEPDRDLCMLNVAVRDSAAGRQCEELMGRAQRRCLLEFLEGKRPAPGAK